MLNLSKISKTASIEVTNASNYKSVQNFVLDALKAKKSKQLTRDEIHNLVAEYTLKNQRENWFNTDEKYNVFISDAEGANTETKANEFVTKYHDFNKSMSTKVSNLFFNPKHARSFIKNKKYNTIVTVKGNLISLV